MAGDGTQTESSKSCKALAAVSTVLVELGSMSEATRWYNSSEYQDISQLYVYNAMDLALVDGLSPDLTAAGFAQELPRRDKRRRTI